MNDLFHNTLFLSNYEVTGEPIFSINHRGVEVLTTPYVLYLTNLIAVIVRCIFINIILLN
jgi:hypothetical protein